MECDLHAITLWSRFGTIYWKDGQGAKPFKNKRQQERLDGAI
jgi:hypothetical protein